MAKKTNKIANVEEIFPAEYSEFIIKHCNNIQEFTKRYDYVIFMARKAFCFYVALSSNGEIVPDPKCTLLSSRVLSYNIFNQFIGKRIIIVDDVVVRGKSLSYAKKIFDKHGIDVDVYFVACQKEYLNQIDFRESVVAASVFLSETSIFQLSSYITDYVSASMISYNVDQPLYDISFKNEEQFANWKQKNILSNVSDGFQESYDVENLTIHFRPEIIKPLIGFDVDFDHTFVKIRFLHRKGSLDSLALPFIILPELQDAEIELLVERLHISDYNCFLLHENAMETLENKVKIIQYVLADVFFENYMHSQENIIYKLKDHAEHSLFSFDIHAFFWENYNKAFKNILSINYIDQVCGVDSHIMLDKYLASAYDYIFNLEIPNENYYDAWGRPLERKIITFKGISDYCEYATGKINKYILSTVMDILIDRGFLIPSVIHGNFGKSLVRGYKCGEIFNLTQKGISLFLTMINRYADLQPDKPIDRIELEKLFVLFFKETCYNRKLFHSVKKYERDSYSICYSKFGPRVSDNGKKEAKYYVPEKSALTLLFGSEGMGYIRENNQRKYVVYRYDSQPPEEWEDIVNDFVLTFHELKDTFQNSSVKTPLITTYNELLTLLAIGHDKKNKMFSLIAEIYLFANIDLSGPLEKVLSRLYSEREYQGRKIETGIMDGINSGLWKYRCYKTDRLVETTLLNATQYNSSIRRIKIDYYKDFDPDQNDEYQRIIDDAGSLLYEIAFLYNYSLRKYTGREKATVFSNKTFSFPMFRTMKESISQFCCESTEEKILEMFKELKKRATAIVDKCDLCIEAGAFNKIESIDKIFVIYNDKEVDSIDSEFSMISDNDILKKCIFLQKDKTKSIVEQVEQLYLNFSLYEKKSLLIYFDLDHSYEGIHKDLRIASGGYFNGLISAIAQIIPENLLSENTSYFAVCSRKDPQEKLVFPNYVVRHEYSRKAIDGYGIYIYNLIHKKENKAMSGDNGNTLIINNGIFNGSNIAASGTGPMTVSYVNQENLDSFFIDVKNINTSYFEEDENAIKQFEEIKKDAADKNKEGVLEKLKKFALTVGSTLFTKIVTEGIVNVMKANGYFPF